MVKKTNSCDKKDKTIEIFKNPVINLLQNPNPFYGDKVSRNKELEKFALNLERLVIKEKDFIGKKGEAKSLILSIRSNWGHGKTTFVDMWGTRLISHGYTALKFDAWRVDHSEDAFLSFFGEAMRQLNLYAPNKNKKIINKLMRLSAALIVPAAAVLSAATRFDCAEMAKKAADFLKNYGKQKQNIDDFRVALSEFVDLTKGKVIYFFVDELDRCNPLFAIKLLEIIKHIFNVPGVCFIISINQNYLVQTIGKVYGYDGSFAAEYIERFFDFQLSLPEPDMTKYAVMLLEPYLEILDRKFDYIAKNIDVRAMHPMIRKSITLKKYTLYFFKSCCQIFVFSLRDIEKQVREIKHFLDANLSAEHSIPDIFLPVGIFLLCLKRKNADDYSKLDLGKLESYVNSFPDIIDKEIKELFVRSLEVFFASRSKKELGKFVGRVVCKDKPWLREIFFSKNSCFGQLPFISSKDLTGEDVYKILTYKNIFKSLFILLNATHDYSKTKSL